MTASRRLVALVGLSFSFFLLASGVLFAEQDAVQILKPVLVAPKAMIPIATTPTGRQHLVHPRPEYVEYWLRQSGAIKEGASAAEVEKAVVDYFNRFDKESGYQVPDAVRQRRELREFNVSRGGISRVVNGTPTSPAQAAVQQVSAAILAMAVDFGGTDTVQYATIENNQVVQKTVTKTGPAKGLIPQPGAQDNFSVWYPPDKTAVAAFYEKLIFEYEGAGRVRMDLTDPKDGQPGINLAGYTVQDYYDHVAGAGNVKFTGRVVGWVTVDHSQAYYGAPSLYSNDGGGDVPVAQLVVDTLNKFNQANPNHFTDTSSTAFWPQFDKNHDGVVDTFWLIHAGIGQEEAKSADDALAIWSHSSDLRYYYDWQNGLKVYEGDTSTTDDDIVVGPYTMQPENAGLSVLVHELGHNLFSLPDLYTKDMNNSVAGWDEWGSGSSCGPLSGTIPVGMSLWMRYIAMCGDEEFCNWHEPMIERAHNDPTEDIPLGQLEDTPAGTYKGVRINLPPVKLWMMNYAGAGKGAYSGYRREEGVITVITLDRTLTLPAGAPNVLTFASNWDIETDWDYGFVLVKDGTSWVALDDMDGILREDDPNSNNLYGHGLTGWGFSPLRFDLSPWAGKSVTVRLAYRTDEYVTGYGWWVDDMKLDGTPIDDFEAASGTGSFPDWTNSSPGWLVAPIADDYPSYYMVEWRAESKYDSALKAFPVIKQLNEQGMQAEPIPYNIPGALIYYRNTRYPFSYSMVDNLWDEPSLGPKHQLLVVDVNPKPVILDGPTDKDDMRTSANIGSYDATLSHQSAPTFTLTEVLRGTAPFVGPWTIQGRDPVKEFNDGGNYFAGLFTGAPCSAGSLCWWGSGNSAVIPARGKYSVRYTNYADVVQEDPGWSADGFRLGTGRPDEEQVQHGVQVELRPSGGDPQKNVLRVGYATPAAGPNLEISQEYPANLLVGATTYYAFTVANVGLGPTTGPVTVRDYLPNGVSFLSGGGGGWACEASSGMVTCTRETAMQPGERSRLELIVKVDRRFGTYGFNEMEATTQGDTSLKNNTTVEVSTFVDSRTLYFPQVADGTVGTGKFQTTIVLVNTGPATPVQVEAYDSNGRNMLVNVDWLGSSSQVPLELLNGESFTFQTSGQGGLRVGYVKLIAPASVNGTAVFSYSENGVTLYEAGVPGVSTSKEFSMVMDSIPNVRQTGLALVNAGSTTGTVTLRLYDKAFNLKGTKILADLLADHAFNVGDHVAKFALEIFPEIATLGLEEGSITVESDVELAALTLRQNDNPNKGLPDDVINLSAFPVIEGRAERTRDPGPLHSFYFGQFANGAVAGLKFHTSLILMNTNAEASVKVDFFDANGQPMAARLVGQVEPVQSLTFNLAKGNVRALQTTGTGELQVGYVKVTASSDVGGTAVFTYAENGVVCYEAGVPASPQMKDFTIAVDSSASLKTGLAIVNAGIADANVTFRLYYPWFSDPDTGEFDLEATKTIVEVLGPGQTFSPGRHLARYMTEIFSDTDMYYPEWVVTVESDQPLAAVTLRQHDDPNVAFPNDIPIVTTFPVVAGRADK